MNSTPSIVPALRSLLWLGFFVFVFCFVIDAMFFHGLLHSPSRNPGPSSNWLAKPYTNLRLYGQSTHHARKKASHNDWAFSDVTFSKGHFKSMIEAADKKGDAIGNRFIKP